MAPLAGGQHILRGIAGPDFSIGYISSDGQVRIDSEAGATSYFVNFGVEGKLCAASNRKHANITPAEATVFNPGDTQELRSATRGSGLLGVRIDARMLQDELAGLLGHPVESPTRFELGLDLSKPKARAIGLLVRSLVDHFDSGDPLFGNAAVQRTLMRPFVTALLLAHRHTLSDELSDEPSRCRPA